MAELVEVNQTQLTAISKELRPRLEREAADERNPHLPATRDACKALLEAIDQDDARVADDRTISEILARLQVHYWRPDFTAAQTASLYADMIDDLSGCSEGILRAAVADYRSDPDARFFPRSGDLIGRIDIANRRRVRARFNLRRALANDAEKNSKQVAQVQTSAHPVPKERRKALADMARKVVRSFGTPPMENTQ
jgi:hypothetical protein